MRFVDRLALLVKADAHGVMDQLEEPVLLFKQHLREAELELDRKRAQLGAMEEEERSLGEEAQAAEARLSSLDADVDLALSRDEEELARFALRQLLQTRQDLERVRERQRGLASSRARIAERLEVQQRRFEDLRLRVRARLSEAERCREAGRREHFGVPDEEIEFELLRRRKRGEARSATTEGGH